VRPHIAPRKLTRDEYLAEIAKVHGENPRQWKVQCPVCGKVYSLQECGDTSEVANRGLFGCIGRINEKGGEAFGETSPNEHGCNFSANGLFRSPWLFFEQEIDVGEGFGIMPIAPAIPPLQAAVYIDSLMTCLMSAQWRWPKSCHMFVAVGTDLEVLHAFAARIGLRREWFQNKPGGVPHYDLNAKRRAAAVKAGAIELERRPAVAIFRAWRGRAER
jgi:hypothetical protein